MEYRQLHFSRKHQLIAFLSKRCDGLTYTCRHGLIKGMRRRGGLGFLPAFLADTETAETRFLASLPLQGKVVYDVGAFVGLLTLFFARQAKQVIAYEPNPPSYARALENIALNHLGNVQVRNFAVGSEPAVLTLAYDPLMPGAASGADAVRTQVEQTASQTVSTAVGVVRLDEDIRDAGLPAPDLIKIDVEGMELAVLQGAGGVLNAHPALYIEMHGSDIANKRANARAVLEFLWSRGYRKILNVEAGTLTNPENVDRPSHLYATV
jgi:FkbM family methyltransferase